MLSVTPCEGCNCTCRLLWFDCRAIFKEKNPRQVEGELTLKTLPYTQRSARFDAAEELDELVDSLDTITNDETGDHKADTRLKGNHE